MVGVMRKEKKFIFVVMQNVLAHRDIAVLFVPDQRLSWRFFVLYFDFHIT
jgi:hypothetical protein